VEKQTNDTGNDRTENVTILSAANEVGLRIVRGTDTVMRYRSQTGHYNIYDYDYDYCLCLLCVVTGQCSTHQAVETAPVSAR